MTDTFELQLRRAIDPLSERLRTVVAEHLDGIAAELTRSVESEVRSAADAAAAESASTTEREITARLTESFAARERAADAALRESRARADADHRDALERLARGVALLDRAHSLSLTFDGLMAAAEAEASSAAVFLIQHDALRMWKQAGFDTLGEAPHDLPMAAAGVAADAVHASAARRCANGDARWPSFADPAAAVFVAAPVVMDGQAVALVCASAPASADEGAALQSTLDILARHAARVLEALTASRLAQVGPQVVAAASPPMADR